jgi:hypothetical protein
MNDVESRLRTRGVHDLSNELCEIFEQQFDALQHGLAELELEQYLERRRRIHQLQTELKTSVHRPS